MRGELLVALLACGALGVAGCGSGSVDLVTQTRTVASCRVDSPGPPAATRAAPGRAVLNTLRTLRRPARPRDKLSVAPLRQLPVDAVETRYVRLARTVGGTRYFLVPTMTEPRCGIRMHSPTEQVFLWAVRAHTPSLAVLSGGLAKIRAGIVLASNSDGALPNKSQVQALVPSSVVRIQALYPATGASGRDYGEKTVIQAGVKNNSVIFDVDRVGIDAIPPRLLWYQRDGTVRRLNP